jgi:hypothetical protein
MTSTEELPSLFSWERTRSTEELGDFINRRVAALEYVSLED